MLEVVVRHDEMNHLRIGYCNGLLCIHLFRMPLRIPTWALALFGVIIVYLGTRSLFSSPKVVEQPPTPGSRHGEPTFRQRLVAIGDLHGGKSKPSYDN